LNTPSRFSKIETQNIKFHENPSSGSQVVPCRQAGRQADGQTNMTKLRVALHDFVNTSKNWEVHGINKSMGLHWQLKTGNITHFVTSVFSRRGYWK
jgi:hypothetical protein